MNGKCKKTLFALFAAFAGVARTTFAAGGTFESDGVTWTWEPSDYGEGAARAYLKGVSGPVDAAKIPWTFTVGDTTYTVTEIGGFSEKISGTLTLPESVVYLHGSVFKDCTDLTGDVSNLANVTKLGKEVFMSTKVYGDVSLSPSLDIIGANAFRGSKITSVKIPDGITAINEYAFREATITNVVIPRSMTSIGDNAFRDTLLKGVLIPGPATVASENQTYAKFSVLSQFFYTCNSLRTIVFGPNTMTNGAVFSSQRIARSVRNVTALVPAGRGWAQDCLFSDSVASTCKLIEYGPGEELDLDIDLENKLMTATVASEDALTNILSQASIFKSEFGMDTKVNITNAFEVSEGMISKAMLSGASFDYLMFAVKSQEQLDNVLAAVATDIPLVIDIDGAELPITVPAGRRISILAKGEWTFDRTRTGLSIRFR